MQIREAMATDVHIVSPNQSIYDAARIMAEADIGSLPVGEDGRLVGLVTDRDITVRAVAAGKSTDTPVREIMTTEVKYCYEDDEASAVARNMNSIQLHRLVVLNRDKKLVGIVSLADIAGTEGKSGSGGGSGMADGAGERSG